MATAPIEAECDSPCDLSGWSFTQYVSWYTIGLVLLVVRGPVFIAAFTPTGDFIGDFGQDWASARNYQLGVPVYDGTREAYRRHIGNEIFTDDLLPRNAHPPGSILIVLPLAHLSYPQAHQAWNLLTFPLMVLAVVLIVRELRVEGWLPAVLPALAFAVVCDPLVMQIMVGNFSCLLAFLITAAWVADRREFVFLAGTLIGIAAGIKLFPAYLLLYFLATKRWRGIAGFTWGFMLINGPAMWLMGFESYRMYFLEIAPAVAHDNVASWLNASLPGFWTRITGPTGSHGVIAAIDAPFLGRVFTFTSQVIVTMIVAWVAWRNRNTTGRDRAYAMAVVGMMLVMPLAWPHTFLMLIVPVALLLHTLPHGPWRWTLIAGLIVLWMPANYLTQLVIGPRQAILMWTDRHEPLSPALNLFTISITTYVLAWYFILTSRIPCQINRANTTNPTSIR